MRTEHRADIPGPGQGLSAPTRVVPLRRSALIDTLRGFCLLSMILFHFCYDVTIIWGKDLLWYGRPPVFLWQQSICWGFILLSGLSWRWGLAKNLRRGLFLNLCGCAVSGVTYLAMPSGAVWFGILNFMGCAVLLLLPLHKYLNRIPPLLGAAGNAVLFFLFRSVNEGYLGSATLPLPLPSFLYSFKFLTPFGFPFPGFSSGDYFPLLPWFFLFLVGYFIAPLLLHKESPTGLLALRLPLLSQMGRHSIWIYLAHQPLCFLVCFLWLG